MELSADPNGKLEAVVVESEVHQQKGAFSALIIKQGVLKVGDLIGGGGVYGKIRALINWEGKRLKEAGSSTPVQVLGLSSTSLPGQIFVKVGSERTARRMAEETKEKIRQKSLHKREKITLESIFSSPQEKVKTLNLILRADSQGALRAIADVLANMEDENIKVKVISQGIGNIKKSDVLLAASSEATIFSFNVIIPLEIQTLANQEEIEIREYRIIYDIIEDVKLSLKGMLEPVYIDDLVAKIEVRDTFKIPRVGTVAGCYVLEGKVVRGAKAKIIRKDKSIGEGVITSLKRFDRDINEVSTGLECGLKVEGANEVQKGDSIEVYQQRRVR